MEDFKTYGLNILALGFSVTALNPYLQMISLLLAIGYTVISISKKL